MWFLFFLIVSSSSAQLTCSTLKQFYRTADCCDSSPTRTVCAEATAYTWHLTRFDRGLFRPLLGDLENNSPVTHDQLTTLGIDAHTLYDYDYVRPARESTPTRTELLEWLQTQDTFTSEYTSITASYNATSRVGRITVHDSSVTMPVVGNMLHYFLHGLPADARIVAIDFDGTENGVPVCAIGAGLDFFVASVPQYLAADNMTSFLTSDTRKANPFNMWTYLVNVIEQSDALVMTYVDGQLSSGGIEMFLSTDVIVAPVDGHSRGPVEWSCVEYSIGLIPGGGCHAVFNRRGVPPSRLFDRLVTTSAKRRRSENGSGMGWTTNAEAHADGIIDKLVQSKEEYFDIIEHLLTIEERPLVEFKRTKQVVYDQYHRQKIQAGNQFGKLWVDGPVPKLWSSPPGSIDTYQYKGP